MTDGEPPCPRLDVLAVVTTIEDLLTRIFPDEFRAASEDGVESGPGYHLVVLTRSEDFWEDTDYSRMSRVEGAFDAQAEQLAEELTTRWGTPHRVELAWDDDTALPVEQRLSGETGRAVRWHRGDRVVYVAVGQGDKELPFELLVGVGQSVRAGACSSR